MSDNVALSLCRFEFRVFGLRCLKGSLGDLFCCQ